jgi:hypothetical protein
MPDWLDYKYAEMLGPRVQRLRRLGPRLWNFRCPLCGDSEKSKHKARGYVYEKGGKLLFHCHNCTQTRSLPNLLREVAPDLHEDYRRERLLEEGLVRPKPVDTSAELAERLRVPAWVATSQLASLRKVSQLRSGHPCRDYLDGRRIPPEAHHLLFYAPEFKAWANRSVPGKFHEPIRGEHPRLVIPTLDREGELVSVTGRSIDGTDPRYMDVVLRDDVPAVFGIDRADLDRRVWVMEGQLDSLFVPNAVAVGGSALWTAVSEIPEPVLVFDDQPRNPEIVKAYTRAVERGLPVVVWPEGMPGKDVNEMVLGGMPVRTILETMGRAVKTGLAARLAVSEWRRC